jgi:hypothetical protein
MAGQLPQNQEVETCRYKQPFSCASSSERQQNENAGPPATPEVQAACGAKMLAACSWDQWCRQSPACGFSISAADSCGSIRCSTKPRETQVRQASGLCASLCRLCQALEEERLPSGLGRWQCLVGSQLWAQGDGDWRGGFAITGAEHPTQPWCQPSRCCWKNLCEVISSSRPSNSFRLPRKASRLAHVTDLLLLVICRLSSTLA